MSEKRVVLESLGLGGQSPESLTIAEYIQVLGNGSSRPTAPSGTAPQANISLPLNTDNETKKKLIGVIFLSFEAIVTTSQALPQLI